MPLERRGEAAVTILFKSQTRITVCMESGMFSMFSGFPDRWTNNATLLLSVLRLHSHLIPSDPVFYAPDPSQTLPG